MERTVFFLVVAMLFSTLVRSIKVNLHLRTTSCTRNCILPPTTSVCPSLLTINDHQQSQQRDGFNIATVDTRTGRISTQHFNWFVTPSAHGKFNGNLLPRTDVRFQNFLGNITRNSVVVVVLQNICAHNDKGWHKHLQKAGITMADLPRFWYSHTVAIVVGCKGTCPWAANGSVPYTYFGKRVEFEKSLWFMVNTTKLQYENKVTARDENIRASAELAEGDTDNQKDRRRGELGSIFGGIIAVVFLICIGVILYITNKRSVETHMQWSNIQQLVCWKTKPPNNIVDDKQQQQQQQPKSDNEEALLEEPRYETMNAYSQPPPTQQQKQQKQKQQQQQVHIYEQPSHNTYEQIPSLALFHVGTPPRIDTPPPPPPATTNTTSSEEPVYEVITPRLLKGGVSTPSSRTDMTSSRDVTNDYYAPSHAWKSHHCSNIQGITSVCSLVTSDCHNSDTALLEPPGIASVCSLVADALINDNNKKLKHSAGGRKHSRKHRHSSIGRSESTPDVVGHHGRSSRRSSHDSGDRRARGTYKL